MKSLYLIFALCGAFIAQAEEVVFLGNEQLQSAKGWKCHRSKLIPAKSNTPAVIEFLTKEYNAVYRQDPVAENWPKKLMVEMEYRYIPDKDFKDKALARVPLHFYDRLNKQLRPPKGFWNSKRLKVSDQWKTLRFPVAVPDGAVKMDFRFSSSFPGRIEVKSLRIYAPGLTAPKAAAKGIQATSVVTGTSEPPNNSSVIVKYFKSVPQDPDSSFWDRLPGYRLRKTDKNKTAPKENDAEVSFKMACDSHAFFIYMTAKDDILNFISTSISGRDSFEFYINPTGLVDKSSRYERKDMQIIVSYDRNSKEMKLGGYRFRGRNLGASAVGKVTERTFTAVLRLPFKTDGWEFKPFNGFQFTGNVMYNDSDKLEQENVLSYAEDNQGLSWKDKSKFTLFTIHSDQDLAYAPVILPYQKRAAIPVEARFAGVFNLEKGDLSKGIDNYTLWTKQNGFRYYVDSKEKFQEKNAFCIDGSDLNPRLKKSSIILGSPFNVVPGEKLLVSFHAKADKAFTTKIRGILLTRSNWIISSIKFKVTRFTDKWTKYTGEITVPGKHTGMNRQVRLFLNISGLNRNKLHIADRKIIRMVPENVDMRIRTPKMFSHFDSDKPKTLLFDLKNIAENERKNLLVCEIRDYLTGKKILSRKWNIDLKGGELKTFEWNMNISRRGFYDVAMKLCRNDGVLLMQRNLAFTIGTPTNGIISNFFGVWIPSGHQVPVFSSERLVAKFIHSCGINKIFIAEVGKETEPGKVDFNLFDRTVNNFYREKFEISSKVGQSVAGSRVIERDSDVIFEKCRKTAEHYKGKINNFCYANEPNLVGGWAPSPDGREWANTYRSAFNGFRTGDPNVKISLGDLNNMPVEFLKQYYSQNSNVFAGSVIGIHPYRYNYDDDAFEELIKEREAIYQLFPGCEVRDTESGTVYKTYPQLMNVSLKKEPALKCAGISRHYFYPVVDIFWPYADSSPLLPIRTFQTVIYNKTKPLGKIFLSKDVCGFLFAGENERCLAVIWSKTGRRQKLELPVNKGAVLYDLYGNKLKTSKSSKLKVELDDTHVKYIDGVDRKNFLTTYRFLAAFSSPLKSESKSGYVANPYVVIDPFQGLFTRDIPLKQNAEIPVIIRNDSNKEHTININIESADPSLLSTLVKPEKITLKPHSKKQLVVNCRPKNKFSDLKLKVGGTTADGGKLVPLCFTLNTSAPVTAEGFSRMVLIMNNTAKDAEVKMSLSEKDHYFKPAVFVNNMKPGKSMFLPFVSGKMKRSKDSNRFSFKYMISLSTSPDRQFYGTCYSIVAEREEAYSVFKPGSKLKYRINPETLSTEKFTLEFSVVAGPDYLRIIARVHDPSPRQNGIVGELRNQGDCLVIGIDRDELQNSTLYGKRDFEAGFALRNNKPESYMWNGKFGLESAKPAGHLVKQIKCVGNNVYYDIVIPMNIRSKSPDRIGLSILAINRTKDDKDEICEFGAGLSGKIGERSMNKFGILKLK